MGFGNAKEKPKQAAKRSFKDFEAELIAGYHNMSQINLSLAEEAVQADNDALSIAEQNLRSVKKK